MKKLIAGAALVSTILGSGAYALADNDATATTQSTSSANATSQGGATSAQTDATVQASSNLPQVTLTPDKMLYVLKMWAEKIQLVVTTDAAGKAALLETQAQTRLAEARAMAQAGKQELAQSALMDAKVKLEAAQKAIDAAAKANKDMSKLTTKLEADHISFAGAITALLTMSPESVRAEFQPVAAELMVQIAANQDAVKKDDAVAKQAAKLAEEAKLETEASGLQPRMLLVLNAMAEASGKDLSEVYAMYQANPGLGHTAQELGLTMGAVEHTAQIEWKVTQQAAAKAGPAAPPAPAPAAATQASLGAAVQGQVNSAAPATQAPASKASAKAAAKAEHETDKVEKAATKAATKVEKAAAKAEADDDDREEADDDVKVEAGSTTGISFPLVNVKLHGEHGQKGGH